MKFWNRENETAFLVAMEDIEKNEKMSANKIEIKLSFNVNYNSEDENILKDIKTKFNLNNNLKSEDIVNVLEEIYNKDINYFLKIWEYILQNYSYDMENDTSYWIGEKIFGIFCYDQNEEIYNFIRNNEWMQIILFNKNLTIGRHIKYFIENIARKNDYTFFEKILNYIYDNKNISKELEEITENLIEGIENYINDENYKIISKHISNLKNKLKLENLLKKYYKQYTERKEYSFKELVEKNNINKDLKICLNYEEIKNNKIINISNNDYDYTVVAMNIESLKNIEYMYCIKNTKVCVLNQGDAFDNILDYSSGIKLYCDILNTFKKPIFIKIYTIDNKKDSTFYFRNVDHIFYYLKANKVIKSKPHIENSEKLCVKDGSFCDYIVPKCFSNQFEHKINFKNKDIFRVNELDKKELDYIKEKVSKADLNDIDIETCNIYRIYYKLLQKYPIHYETEKDIQSLKTWRAKYIQYFYFKYGYEDGEDGYYPSQLRVIVKKDNLDEAIYIKDLNMYVMSYWEANIIRLLNYLKINYEYEKELINMDNINYIPDIFLQDGTVIEIKGYWDKGSLTKCYEYAQLNSNYYIIDSDLYYDLQKKYGKIVKDWTFQENILKIIKAKVVGINFNERKKYVENIKVDDKIVLKRETDNKFDKMAVKIENENGNQLGYLAKEWANIYARKLDIGMEFEAVVKEKNDSNLIIEIKRINNEQEKIYEILKG